MTDVRRGPTSNSVAPAEIAPSAYVERAITVLSAGCALIALAALADLAVRAAVRLELRWDTFMYHIPFAALRGGLRIPYEMNETMGARYQGFPPLPHLLQGMLWRLTGSINATGVVNYLAFVAFLAYCHIALKARFWLVALIALSAPMVLIHTTVSYVDLFGNSLLAIGVSSCLYLYLFPERFSRSVLLCGLAGLVGAAWSKYLLVPPVVLVWCLFVAVSLCRSRREVCSLPRALVPLAAAALLAALPYLKNFAVYGNPFWPMPMPIMMQSFPYTEDPHPIAQRPPPLKDASQPTLFIHSLFEIKHPTHYGDRPRWIIDQGNAWIAFRMGGFWNVGVVAYLLSTMIMLVVHDRRTGTITSIVTVGVLCFVAILPQSHELRFYQFIPLSWAAAIGILFPHLRKQVPLGALAFLMITTGLFAYMVYENQVHYRISNVDYMTAAREWGAAEWWDKLERGQKYCVVDMVPIGILLTGPTMSEYSIVERSREALCPPGTTVLTKDGLQSRNVAGARQVPAPSFNAADVLLEESMRHYQAGRFKECVEAAAQSAKLNPNSAPAFTNIGICSANLQRWDAAIENTRKALRLDPNFQLARNNLAWMQQQIVKVGGAKIN
jgi:hypothetical protein